MKSVSKTCGFLEVLTETLNPPKSFFVNVNDRRAAMLNPIIKRWILPGTTIASDYWKSHSSLKEEGYIHKTVNHSIQFVSTLYQH